ncbi:hypothetical protein DR999_PMT20785 [Platysternon megacephalum]|uniref:Uncharacterized protein n=1 Tax=Platysternon megacephalum TaxID=55544 RepID=A0A4D9DJ84_9SAUR|nr:hypothetical protein DR999_PMT20785 [Platysternon megacephalum]
MKYPQVKPKQPLVECEAGWGHGTSSSGLACGAESGEVWAGLNSLGLGSFISQPGTVPEGSAASVPAPLEIPQALTLLFLDRRLPASVAWLPWWRIGEQHGCPQLPDGARGGAAGPGSPGP